MQFGNKSGGVVELIDGAVVLHRKGASPETTTIPFSSIREVVFKDAGITNGYVQFCTDTRKKVSSLSQAISDPNTILFSKGSSANFAQLRNLLNAKLGQADRETTCALEQPASTNAPDPTEQPAEQAPAAKLQTPSSAARKKANNGGWFWVFFLGVILLMMIGRCSPDQTSSSTNVDENLTTDMNASDLESNASSSEPAQIISRYLATDTNVRTSPNASSRTLGMLTRGMLVEGSLVAGTGAVGPWLKLTSGPHSGGFILAMRNLRETSPPALDTTVAGLRVSSDRSPIYSEPDLASEVLDYTAAGKRMRVYGRTADGFLEVWVRSGLVGYVSEEALVSPTEPNPDASDTDDDANPIQGTSSTQPASAVGDIRSLFSPDDYPASAQAMGAQGTVQASLTVGPDGRVYECSVIRSSGNATLDNATCGILRRRAKFSPARNDQGQPVPATVVTPPITWRLEN